MIVKVKIVRETIVEVDVNNFVEALTSVREMYESGDGCAELDDASYIIVDVREETK